MKKLVLFLLPLFLFVSCGSTTVVKEDPPAPVEEPKEPDVVQPEPEVVVEPQKPVVEEPKKKEPTEIVYKDYIVKRKDSYHTISEKQYGNRHLWPCIYYANVKKYPNPDLIRPKAIIKIPVISSIEADSEQIKSEMMNAYIQAYEKYLNQAGTKKSKAAREKNRSRAVGVLVSAELLYPGFMSENDSKINSNHIAEAKKLLSKKYKK